MARRRASVVTERISASHPASRRKIEYSVVKNLLDRLEAKLDATYSAEYAREYRNGEERGQEWLRNESAQWRLVNDVARSFTHPIVALDLGCGTGRYLNALVTAKRIVGVDYSDGMLQQARMPVGGRNERVALVRGNLLTIEFAPRSFDMITCIGVLGASCPFTEDVVVRFKRFVRPGGKVVFTVMSEPKMGFTLKSRLATAALPFLVGPVRQYVYVKIGMFHTPATLIYDWVHRYFDRVELVRWQSPSGNIETHVIASA